MRLTAGSVIGGLLVIYAVFSYYMVLGIPGVPYPKSFSRAMGWPEVTRELHAIHDRLARETGAAPVIVGMDKYNIASQVSFFGTREYAAAGQVPLKATTIEALSGNALMFSLLGPAGAVSRPHARHGHPPPGGARDRTARAALPRA